MLLLIGAYSKGAHRLLLNCYWIAIACFIELPFAGLLICLFEAPVRSADISFSTHAMARPIGPPTQRTSAPPRTGQHSDYQVAIPIQIAMYLCIPVHIDVYMYI